MKLTFIILTIFLLQVNAAGFAQKVTFQKNKVTIKQIFSEIRKQTGYNILWPSERLKEESKLNVSFKDASLDEVLKVALAGQNFSYQIKDQTIVVKEIPKESLKTITEPQLQDIKGRVLDEKGLPLVGVSVKVKGTTIVTTTNGNGEFSLRNPDNKELTLQFIYIGYISKELVSNGEKMMNVSLVPKTDDLNEVVVTAMGISRQKRSLTYAVSEIKAKDIVHAGTDNLSSALIGKLPGVDISNMAGGPMTGSRINIRGINTLDGNNRPLIILDGIPFNDNDDGFSSRGAGGTAKGSLLNSINPDDIASLTVLRGGKCRSSLWFTGIEWSDYHHHKKRNRKYSGNRCGCFYKLHLQSKGIPSRISE